MFVFVETPFRDFRETRRFGCFSVHRRARRRRRGRGCRKAGTRREFAVMTHLATENRLAEVVQRIIVHRLLQTSSRVSRRSSKSSRRARRARRRLFRSPLFPRNERRRRRGRRSLRPRRRFALRLLLPSPPGLRNGSPVSAPLFVHGRGRRVVAVSARFLPRRPRLGLRFIGFRV